MVNTIIYTNRNREIITALFNVNKGITAAKSNNLLIGGNSSNIFDGQIDDFSIYLQTY